MIKGEKVRETVPGQAGHRLPKYISPLPPGEKTPGHPFEERTVPRIRAIT